MENAGVINAVHPDSIADEIGLVPGDRLLAVNGELVRDIIDLSFALAEEEVTLLVEKQNGEQEEFEIEKDCDEELGIEFESAVFDGVRRCANRCIFCFVDQMPAGMRESLYVKDDDYRLSFLYGNFITLTNLTAADIERIKKLHLSPLYISVHTTDGLLREKMLNQKRAKDIMQQINILTESGIEIHTQVVLCPGINDGVALEQTINDLYQLYPMVLSMAIVPVGLTKYRETCYPMQTFTPDEARTVILAVQKWQERARKEHGVSFVHLGDEFYLASGSEMPDYDAYDGFPQLENGVGLVRNFMAQWQEIQQDKTVSNGYDSLKRIDVVCGASAQKIFQPLIADLKISNLIINLVSVENEFFGSHITVSGLLTGQDILNKLIKSQEDRHGIIIPGAALRKGEEVFLDGLTLDTLEEKLQVPIRVAYSAYDLYQLLTEWE